MFAALLAATPACRWPGPACRNGTLCGGRCLATNSDPGNCGGCGDACPPEHDCAGGRCVPRCEAGETNCAGTCADLLADPRHCGSCATACASGLCFHGACCRGTNVAGRCWIVLAAGGPAGLAVEDGSVYWTAPREGAVMKTPVEGGMSTTLVRGRDHPVAIAVDPSFVYWTDYNQGGSVMKVPLHGGTATTLASHQAFAEALAAGERAVYWTGRGRVTAAPLGGGRLTTLASQQALPFGIAVSRAAVFWTDHAAGAAVLWRSVMWGPSAHRIALKGILERTMRQGEVMAAPLAGGPPWTVAAEQAGPGGIATDGRAVYWTDDGSGRVMAAALPGGSPTVLASGQQGPGDIAVDGASVYWVNFTSGTVMKAPLGGGDPVTLASGQNEPGAIAVDGSSVYWTDATGEGRLMKLTPK